MSTTTAVDLRWAHLARRLPPSLTSMHGPLHGTVNLPVHIAWSGLTCFDLNNDKLLLGMYRLVLLNGRREDIEALLDADILIRRWPVLRRMIGSGPRRVWENTYPELAQTAA